MADFQRWSRWNQRNQRNQSPWATGRDSAYVGLGFINFHQLQTENPYNPSEIIIFQSRTRRETPKRGKIVGEAKTGHGQGACRWKRNQRCADGAVQDGWDQVGWNESYGDRRSAGSFCEVRKLVKNEFFSRNTQKSCWILITFTNAFKNPQLSHFQTTNPVRLLHATHQIASSRRTSRPSFPGLQRCLLWAFRGLSWLVWRKLYGKLRNRWRQALLNQFSVVPEDVRNFECLNICLFNSSFFSN